MRRRGVFAVLGLVAGLAWGCAAPQTRVQHYVVRPVPPKAVLKLALAQLGKPYAYGGDNPHEGFDCSGLVYWCYHQFHSNLPRLASEQYHAGQAVEKGDLRAGDLVFFDTASGRKKPAHVGIMLNRDRFIHAPAGGEPVREDELRNNYWKKTYYGARRIE